MKEMGVPPHLIALTCNLYADSRATVRLDDTYSPEFEPSKGVRQGCILSPLLFNIYGEYIMRKSLDGWKGGVRIGGETISNLRFADDTTSCAKTEEEMKEFLERVDKYGNELGLTLNKSKTKVMVIDRSGRLTVSNALQYFEKVTNFTYLGSVVDSVGGSSTKIRRRIIVVREATMK